MLFSDPTIFFIKNFFLKSSSDISTAARLIRFVMEEHPTGPLPLKQIKTLVGDIVYGGRISDESDRRILDSLLSICFHNNCAEPDYDLCSDHPGVYTVPASSDPEELSGFVSALPNPDPPELFCMSCAMSEMQLGLQSRRVALAVAQTQLVHVQNAVWSKPAAVLDIIRRIKEVGVCAVRVCVG